MMDRKIADIIAPNNDDGNGGYWDPWTALGQACLSYNQQIDLDAVAVLRGIGAGKGCYSIAGDTGLSPSHVELLQSIFSGAGWCDYGASPRTCFPVDREGFPALIDAWETHIQRTWGSGQ